MSKELKIEVTPTELQEMISSSMKAFIENSKYMVSRREANKMFGETLIDTLLNNKLLTDSKKLGETKCKFLVSDIIAGMQILRK